ncbi:uncharacterized protein CLUP02_11821 [Colletotrichum lupini]|uniref:Uncharacterized protein n=1 Tax=Colletotrichum lupini TaxID=145971 RepID=A0A9Q8T109_9PEZI|nr:uncharacterized protein CLUP02_11821 [Colletotrichum lupini]UQC86321.1 hypothetical protein CLUP02_11821 [Colletotrichum lupini]
MPSDGTPAWDSVSMDLQNKGNFNTPPGVDPFGNVEAMSSANEVLDSDLASGDRVEFQNPGGRTTPLTYSAVFIEPRRQLSQDILASEPLGPTSGRQLESWRSEASSQITEVASVNHTLLDTLPTPPDTADEPYITAVTHHPLDCFNAFLVLGKGVQDIEKSTIPQSHDGIYRKGCGWQLTSLPLIGKWRNQATGNGGSRNAPHIGREPRAETGRPGAGAVPTGRYPTQLTCTIHQPTNRSTLLTLHAPIRKHIIAQCSPSLYNLSVLLELPPTSPYRHRLQPSIHPLSQTVHIQPTNPIPGPPKPGFGKGWGPVPLSTNPTKLLSRRGKALPHPDTANMDSVGLHT